MLIGATMLIDTTMEGITATTTESIIIIITMEDIIITTIEGIVKSPGGRYSS